MSVPKVFKGREIEMTQDQFASEKASFAVTQDEDEEDIPFIKSDITSSGGVRSFDTSEGKRKRGRPSKNSCLGAKRLKQPIFYTHVEAPEDPNPSDMEPVKDESSTEDGALRSSPETFAQKNRKNGKMQKSTQAVVLSLETAPVASMGPDIPQSRDFRSSPETKENNDSSSEDENDLSVSVDASMRGDHPHKAQNPTSSGRVSRDQGQQSRVSARLRAKVSHKHGPTRSSNKQAASADKPLTTHGRGVCRVKKSSSRGRKSAPSSSEEEYEVECIVDVRVDKRTMEQQFWVKWKGYPSEDNTWEPERNLSKCASLIKAFMKKSRNASITVKK